MKQTVIMIHGFRGTHHGLAKISEQLQQQGDYNIVTPDLPGFGEGDTLTNYSLEDYTGWLETFIKKLDLSEPPILLGHSFGSIITAHFARLHPEMITHLILVNPIGAPALEGPRGILTKLAIFYYWVGRILPEPLAHPWLSSKLIVYVMSSAMAKTSDTQLRRWIHQQHYTYFSRFHSADSLSKAFITSVSHSVRDDAPHITTPTLLIVGDIDDITPLEKQYELQKLINGSTLQVIKNVGHLTHYETPDQVAHLVQAFITSE